MRFDDVLHVTGYGDLTGSQVNCYSADVSGDATMKCWMNRAEKIVVTAAVVVAALRRTNLIYIVQRKVFHFLRHYSYCCPDIYSTIFPTVQHCVPDRNQMCYEWKIAVVVDGVLIGSTILMMGVFVCYIDDLNGMMTAAHLYGDFLVAEMEEQPLFAVAV